MAELHVYPTVIDILRLRATIHATETWCTRLCVDIMLSVLLYSFSYIIMNMGLCICLYYCMLMLSCFGACIIVWYLLILSTRNVYNRPAVDTNFTLPGFVLQITGCYFYVLCFQTLCLNTIGLVLSVLCYSNLTVIRSKPQ